VTTMPSTESAWREVLRPDQYAVLRQSATERPFHGEYVDTDDDGTYRCAGCRAPLFSSGSKYHSGSGWPSFTEPMDDATVDLVPDLSHGMVRTEIRCGRAAVTSGTSSTTGRVTAAVSGTASTRARWTSTAARPEPSLTRAES
jgi:peptide-methionine (R)-S-oxide reductase